MARFGKAMGAAAAVALTAGLVTVGALPAAAASHAGVLRVRGPNNTPYAVGAVQAGPFGDLRTVLVSQVGTAKAPLTFTVEVLNTGKTTAQYNVRVVQTQLPVTVTEGSTVLTPLITSPDGYYTHSLDPGRAEVLTVKTSLPVSSSTHIFATSLWLSPTDGTTTAQPLSEANLISEIAAPKSNGLPHDMFIKSGAQKPIGWAGENMIMTAGTVAPTGSASFTVTLRNNGALRGSIPFQLLPDNGCSSVAVRVTDGAMNVTSAALDGTYSTPQLPPGQQRNLTVTISGNHTTCGVATWYARTSESATSLPTADELVVNYSA